MLATTVSTLLLAAVVADWIYSINNSETLVLVRGSRVYAIDNYNGEIAFWSGKPLTTIKPAKKFWHEHWERPNAKTTGEFSIDNPGGSEWSLAGFIITTQRHFPTTNISIPPYQITPHL